MKKIGIYKIVSPSNRVYIGQSRNLNKRISNYKSMDCKKQKRLYASFIKHGVNSHEFEIIEECKLEMLNKRERYYQDFYNVISDCGLNCVLTEYDEKVRVYSIETRLKMSKSRTGKMMSAETKSKLAESSRGNSYAKGYKHTKEAKIRMSNAKKGCTTTENQKESARIANSKRVVDTESGIIYNSIKECALHLMINSYTLGRYLNGKRKNKTKMKFL
jgi:group I intron endonuclease